ncbi:hypothetical protein M3Y99_00365500 [Aphelenchoides fujianensis]|nr:hypothetical protein M3Y99_00365500 [Aphelenchoides fujianensis]
MQKRSRKKTHAAPSSLGPGTMLRPFGVVTAVLLLLSFIPFNGAFDECVGGIEKDHYSFGIDASPCEATTMDVKYPKEMDLAIYIETYEDVDFNVIINKGCFLRFGLTKTGDRIPNYNFTINREQTDIKNWGYLMLWRDGTATFQQPKYMNSTPVTVCNDEILRILPRRRRGGRGDFNNGTFEEYVPDLPYEEYDEYHDHAKRLRKHLLCMFERHDPVTRLMVLPKKPSQKAS